MGISVSSEFLGARPDFVALNRVYRDIQGGATIQIAAGAIAPMPRKDWAARWRGGDLLTYSVLRYVAEWYGSVAGVG